MKHISETEFVNEVAERVLGPSKGDAKILVDAQNARTGAGKTSAAVALARLFAKVFDYGLKKEDLTLSGAEYLDRYRGHPGKEQPSVLVLDELVGAGAGDARRAMSNQNVDLARAWQLSRVKRVVTLATLASFSDADRRLRKLGDFRVMCLEKPFGSYKAYKLGAFDFGEKSGVRFKRLDEGVRTHYPDMAGDPLYEHLAEKKDDLLASESYDADTLREEEEDEPAAEDRPLTDADKERITTLYESTDITQGELAEAYDVDRSYISKVARGKA